MNAVTVVPEQRRNCAQHGEFTSNHVILLGRDYGWTPCQACEEEREKAEQERQRQERQARKTARLLMLANIPARFAEKSLDNFETETAEQREVLTQARAYVRDFRTHRAVGRCLVFCGTTGRGKTHLSIAIVQALVRQDFAVRYYTVMELIRALRETWPRHQDERELLHQLTALDLLVLDEIGVQFGTDAERVQLFEVVDARYRAMRPSLLISNLDASGMQAFVGERVLDRMRENGGRMVIFSGPSYRTKATE